MTFDGRYIGRKLAKMRNSELRGIRLACPMPECREQHIAQDMGLVDAEAHKAAHMRRRLEAAHAADGGHRKSIAEVDSGFAGLTGMFT